MKYIALPDNTERSLAFYLAMEEHVAHTVDADDCFFMWQTDPSVIIGRNQLMANEVNTSYCRNNGIQIFRRKSGGGCVYSDRGNIMMSYITRDEHVGMTFYRYVNMLVLVLSRMGIQAEATGRNDVLIGGRKVSGNAFYHIPGRSIVHGTMLYDTDMQHMINSITPDTEKLASKGVESVRQRITLLKEHTAMPIDEFMQHVRQTLCRDTVTLTADDIRCIEEREKEYLTEEFLYGNNPKHTIVRRRRFEGVGTVALSMTLKNNVIASASLTGDYFETGCGVDDILCGLKGMALTREAAERVVPQNIDSIIAGMTREMFISLLLDE